MSEREDLIAEIRDWYADPEHSTWKLADRLLAAGFHRPSTVPVVPSQIELEAAYNEAWDNASDTDGEDPHEVGMKGVHTLLTRSGCLDLSKVRRFSFSDDIPGVIYPDPKGAACWFADLQPKVKP